MQKDTKNLVKLSIIIPLYNKETVIAATISSVLNQSFSDFEVVVVNDGSTDKSADIVRNLHDERIRLISQQNKGISGARNRGIQEAKGEWILFLDADDLLLPDALKLLTENIIDEKTIIAGNFLFRTKISTSKWIRRNKCKQYQNPAQIYKDWLFKRIFLRAGSFIVPSCFAKHNLFNEHFVRYEDLEFLFNCIDKLQVKYIPASIMIYEFSYASSSIPNPENWEKDYLFHVDFKEDHFWKNCVLGEFIAASLNAYPDKYYIIKRLYEKNWTYIRIGKFFMLKRYLSKNFLKKCINKLKSYK